MKTEKKEDKTESTDLEHFKTQFEELSIKDLRLVQDMCRTCLDYKTAEARHKGKFAKKSKDKNGLSMPESSQYRDVDDKTESTDLEHFKTQFEELSIKDLRLVQDMCRTCLDYKTAEARHKGKFAKKSKDKNGLSMPESSQYRDVDEDYI